MRKYEHNDNLTSQDVKMIKGIGSAMVRAVIRNILGAVFLLLLIAFILPATVGIINIGNVLGIVFCLVMLLRTWGFTLYFFFTSFIKQYKWGRILMNIITAVFIIGLVYVAFLTGLIIHADYTSPAEDSTVIVLGCQVRGNTPSLMLVNRLDAACDYLNAHPDAVCIVSGGKGEGEKLSEAQCMFNYLTEKGISADRIYKEDKSVNTKENIKFSKEIIEKYNFSTDTAIVTDIFHQYRASNIVKDNGLNYGSVPAECVWFLIPTYYVRELVAITASFVGLA